ncbi:MAG: DUF4288 domain-containing protein [Verrucomicrobia bacterium]|nr:DUF4288 domain-containing protein [Verrucomicrobiota bacterium]
MKMPKIKSTSPTGWWIAALLVKNPSGDNSAYWNNHRLVRASQWREAFRRAVQMGENDAREGDKAFGAGHEFVGVTDLVPIHDKFEDGAEILFEEYDGADNDPSKPPIDVFTEAELAEIYES